MTTLVEETNLEDIVAALAKDRTFSRNSVAFSLDNYMAGDGSLNPDWIYYLTRDIEDNRVPLNVALEPHLNVNPRRLYRAIPKSSSLKSRTSMPRLPHQAYFALVALVSNNPDSYKGEEGYIQLAKDVRERTGSAAHLAHIWSGARQYRSSLQWPGIIELPLEVFDTIESLIQADKSKYTGEEGYIQLAKDVRSKTGSAAHLATIWSGSRQYRSSLQWPGKIELPLEVFDTIDALVKANPDSYKGEEGYIQLAKDVRSKTGSSANLAHIWSGARQYRSNLQWPGIITIPLDTYLATKSAQNQANYIS